MVVKQFCKDQISLGKQFRIIVAALLDDEISENVARENIETLLEKNKEIAYDSNGKLGIRFQQTVGKKRARIIEKIAPEVHFQKYEGL